MKIIQNTFYEVYEQLDEEKDKWILRSSHLIEEDAEQWVVKLIDKNPDYKDINFRIDECIEEQIDT